MRTGKDRLLAGLMLAPSLALLAVFVYGFIGQTLYVSFTDWGQGAALALNPEIHFVGLDNYRQLFSGILDVRFRQDLVNMLFFTLFFVALCLGLGLLLATLLDRPLRGEGFFRTVLLLPMSLSFVVTGTIWRWLLQPRGGVNVLPALVGLPRLDFLWTTTRDQVFRFNWQDVPGALLLGVGLVLVLLGVRAWRRREARKAGLLGVPGLVLVLWAALGGAAGWSLVPIKELHGFNLALVGIVMAATWQMSGYTMALYLAGLRGIPVELREAAEVDGATPLQVYRYVQLPLLQPITLSAVIILGHIALKIFDLIFAMTGPDNAVTSVPAILMYLTTFRGNQFAKGASIATLLLLLVSMLIIPYIVSSLRKAPER
ncbi:carbohydrate ABC transporter permease [Limnochorda pilosa]|uniref:Glucose transporter n=1 Tax=Limnochorda pilosa TaxID=1555112 RepID=A0A0K2SJM5_LIMPI|nr:sugar ABC transporter permease [Limnochorda pilosa]BAS27054.1 glucose transporter [Limnochorda pilosa]